MPDGPVSPLDLREVADAVEALTPPQHAAMAKAAKMLADGTEFSAADLLQEALTQLLGGDRQCPRAVPLPTVVFNAMRSIAWASRQRRKRAPVTLRVTGTSNAEEARTVDPADEAGDPERILAAREEYEAINVLFADDPAALGVIMARVDGLPPAETREILGMSATEYDTTWKRVRRAVQRARLQGELG